MISLLGPGSVYAAPRIAVHGHRGARAVLPENTIPAFRHAIEAGADVLELDLAVTKDDVLVVSHDPVLSAPICSGPAKSAVIRELTLAQLRQWDCGAKPNPSFPLQKAVPGTKMPTLDEVLELKDLGSFHFNVETKISPDKPQFTPAPERFAELVLEAVRRHKVEDRFILQSFDWRTLDAMRRLDPKIRLSALYAAGVKDFVAIARETKAEIVSPMFPFVTKERVAAAHAVGVQVVPWTANTPADWDKLIEAGVDAIITDDPAALIAYLRSKHLR